MFYFGIADKEFLKALQLMAAHTENADSCLKTIGEDLKESTIERFKTSTAPDGTAWLLNSVLSTLIDDKKKGDKPLIDSGILMRTINYQIYGDTLAIGSPMEYAAMQNFGGTKSEFPKLWGDIPARQFLGISSEDETNILNIISDYISN